MDTQAKTNESTRLQVISGDAKYLLMLLGITLEDKK